MGDNPDSSLYLLSDVYYARINAIFGGDDDFRDPLEIDADEFIGIKSYRAKGKRIANYEVKTIEELEPLRFPEVDEEELLGSKKIEISAEDDDTDIGENETDIDEGMSQNDIRDEIDGQMKLF
jgi:topoisomerase-4 subunit A